MPSPTRTLAALTTLALLSAIAVPAANAAQSATAGSNKCTVTALAPALTKTSLTGKATVLCTLATTVTLEIGVIELDSTTEDSRVPIVVTSKSVAVKAKTAVTVSTATLTCLNTEAGNEEYATKVRVNISGTVSAWDRFVPKTDQFAC